MGDWKNAVIYTTSFFAVVGLCSVFSEVCGQAGGEIDAKSLYEYHCATCHGADGKGTKRGHELKVPNLADVDWQAKKKDEEILNSITNGKNKMPKWSDKIKPEEIEALAKYVRKLALNKKE